MNVKLINKAGLEKECPVGFSWTMFFFGFFVPLSRGDLLGVLIHFLPSVFSFGIFWLIWPFFYNKNYINRLLDKGYMPCSASDLSVLKDIGINVSNTFDGNRVSNTCEPTPQKSEKVEEVKSPTIAESTPDKPVIKVADENLLGSFDFSNVVSFSWPVALESGSLMKTAGGAGTENLSCSFSFRNMQQRDILYTQWQLKCFDILKKPILTEVPVMVKYEYRVEPKGIVELKSSGKLPEGTKSFVPYLDAVLYEDQTVEEFSKDETLLTLKPRTRIEEVDNFDASGLEEYQRIHSLSQAPKFLYEEGQPVVWPCAFCGTRNLNDTTKCRLCNTPIREDEYCTKDKLEQYFVVYKAQQEKIAEEKRVLLEEEAKAKAEREEKARIEREEKERIERLEQEERERIANIKQKKRFVWIFTLSILIITVGGLGSMFWEPILKPMTEYWIALGYYHTGQYRQSYQAFEQLGDYKDAKERSLEAYVDYLETESAESFRIEGYQWLLDSGYPQQSMYELAEQKVREGWFYEGFWIFSLLGNYNDAREKATDLGLNVNLDLQGGRLGDKEDITTPMEANLYNLPTPIRDGYAFAGWWTSQNYAGTQVHSNDMMSLKPNQMLYAKWFGPIQVGRLGPAGSYIFYDKGDYNDGWRYLEAAPAGNEWSSKVWGGYGTEVGGTGTAIGTGKGNTEKIVAKFGNAEPHEKKADYAAKLCADLVVTKDGVVYDDWFLPSQDELNLMYQNLKKNKLGGLSDVFYWSSSESSANGAWGQGFNYGDQSSGIRYFGNRVRPVRAF